MDLALNGHEVMTGLSLLSQALVIGLPLVFLKDPVKAVFLAAVLGAIGVVGLLVNYPEIFG